MRRSLVLAAGLALSLTTTVAACSEDSSRLTATPVTTVPGPYDYDYLIPEGTAALIARGKDPGIMPTSLDVRVGETIRIVNDDTVGHTVGTFYVLAGTTLAHRFARAGVFEGECSTNPADTFILTVRP
ncbi:MAG: hypothetical protein RLZZ362_2638 [Actinomycetota bacterium]|jgi:plastocyanin